MEEHPKFIQVGCGKDHRVGYFNIDISRACNPDLVHDVTLGLPFHDNTAEVIMANGVIEQIELDNDFVLVLNEIHRVLVPGGKFIGQVPSTDQRVLHLDPKDKRFFQVDSFKYFDHREKEWRNFGEQYGYPQFEIEVCEVNENGIIEFELRAYKNGH